MSFSKYIQEYVSRYKDAQYVIEQDQHYWAQVVILANQKPQTIAVKEYTNNTRHYGEWHPTGLKQGYGVTKYANGDFYFGYFWKDAPSGFGIRFMGNKVYIGTFEMGCFHGNGMMLKGDCFEYCRFVMDEQVGPKQMNCIADCIDSYFNAVFIKSQAKRIRKVATQHMVDTIEMDSVKIVVQDDRHVKKLEKRRHEEQIHTIQDSKSNRQQLEVKTKEWRVLEATRKADYKLLVNRVKEKKVILEKLQKYKQIHQRKCQEIRKAQGILENIQKETSTLV